MYPNSSSGFSKSDIYISPLHEALRGTTAMPVVDEHELEIHQNPAPTPLANNNIALAGFMQSLDNQQEMMLVNRRFLTTPIINNLSISDRLQILSVHPPSFTSLLQGEPAAVVHAHLDVNGVMDPGPIFYDPLTLTHKEEMQKPLGSSLHHGPYGEITPRRFALSPKSYYIQKESELPIGVRHGTYHGIVQPTISPTVVEVERTRRVYPCKLCVAKFYSAQALGGHMSYHGNKMRRN
ncbi:hypothetical protein ACP4OV_020563 [Aristida adscensionis]